MLSYHRDIFISLSSIKRNSGPLWDERTLNGAPYKPLLLLSVMDGIEEGWIPENRIPKSPQLIERFEAYFKSINSPGDGDLGLPFRHLANDNGLWFLNQPHEARLGDELYDLMRSESGRDFIRTILISRYFNVSTGHLINAHRSEWVVTTGLIDQLIAQSEAPFILNQVNDGRTQTVTRSIRDAAFRIIVRRSYDYTCAVCRTRLITPSGKIMVEGAHIVPRNSSYNDDPRNGLALCQNHHWMFDQLMITVRPDHKVVVSRFLHEQPNHVLETLDFNDHKIYLPSEQKLRPASEALLNHYHRFNDVNRLI